MSDHDYSTTMHPHTASRAPSGLGLARLSNDQLLLAEIPELGQQDEQDAGSGTGCCAARKAADIAVPHGS